MALADPLVSFQKFHWLQKAAEHMIGCVLHNPGYFAHFRAKVLTDCNVRGKRNSPALPVPSFKARTDTCS
jgi:hypothetical protein